jgi:hypothetical protein
MQKAEVDHPIKKQAMKKNKNSKTKKITMARNFSVGATALLYALPSISQTRFIFYRP